MSSSKPPLYYVGITQRRYQEHYVMNPTSNIQRSMTMHMFITQQKALDNLGNIEDQLQRNRFAQFWKADEIKNIEDVIENLRDKVLDEVSAGEHAKHDAKLAEHEAELDEHDSKFERFKSEMESMIRNPRRDFDEDDGIASKIANIEQDVNNLRTELATRLDHSTQEDWKLERLEMQLLYLKKVLEERTENPSVEQKSPPRPRSSPVFVGQHMELSSLKKILLNHGSAAITALGGVGKTQLALSFCDAAQQGGDVPGGVFLISADGSVDEIVLRLADRVEFLLERELRAELRSNTSKVIQMFKAELQNRKERWLLLIDNADSVDNAKVARTINELYVYAQDGNGWVIVTKRVDKKKLWDGMKQEQKLVLSTFTIDEGQ